MMKRMRTLGILLGAAMMAAVSVNAADAETDMMTGAYEEYAEEGISEEAADAFAKAMEKYEGTDTLTPVQLLESQLVAGMNYRILCDSETEDMQRNQAVVTVYKDLDGNCEITDITMESKVIKPKRNPNALEEKDFTKHASFTAEDFDLENMTLDATLYTEALYDTVDMHSMKVGDVVCVEGTDVKVEALEKGETYRLDSEGNRVSAASISINKDVAAEFTFVAAEGGTWDVTLDNDHPSMVEEGKVTLPLSENLSFTDCTTEPGSSFEVALADLQEHLDAEGENNRGNYSYYNTVIEVEDGVITSITRTWMP